VRERRALRVVVVVVEEEQEEADHTKKPRPLLSQLIHAKQTHHL
jgi:hypothetical protein